MEYKVKDIELAEEGRRLIGWAEDHMPVLMDIRKDFQKNRPLEDVTIACCLHVTKETAVLMKTLQAGGATVALCGSNPLSTHDSVAAALAEEGIHVYAWRGNSEDYYWAVNRTLDYKPQITMDDGGDLVTTLHTDRQELLEHVIGGTEETTTGVNRQRVMAERGDLRFPLVAVNDAMTKHFFDNRYGTGQSTIDGILRATSVLLAGKTFVVAGYGWCGRGLAMRAEGMGANVIVTEIDEIRALEAVMDGYRVMPMAEAAHLGDIFVTVTGNKHVIDAAALDAMKDGAIVANAGHFDNEINVPYLHEQAVQEHDVRDNTRQYILPDGRSIYLLAEGRLVNLAAAEGHPSEVMDMSFANQALVARWLTKEGAMLDCQVCPVPDDIDREVARRKLETMNVAIDTLTDEQRSYMEDWHEGT
ncbi:MAG: adenosylhomocysteinase [Thermoplasmatota archaeon]